MHRQLLAATVLLAVAITPAFAGNPGPFGLFEYLTPDDGPPRSAGAEQYGEDVVSRGPTLEEPHWHGDAAVPLGLRWHDQGWIGTPAEGPIVEQPPVAPFVEAHVEGGIGAGVAVPRVRHAVPHRRTMNASRRPVCGCRSAARL